MKKISELISLLLNDIKAKMPPLLAGYGLNDFEAYGIGYPTDQNKTFCALRYASGELAEGTERFSFTVHIQLPGMEEAEAYKYIDVVNGYLCSLNGSIYGFPLKTISIELLENFRAADTQCFFDVAMSALVDDCGED
jgi:hypothetical protein